MIVKLLTKQHLEFLSLIGGCKGSSESIHVKMPHGWKSHFAAQLLSADGKKMPLTGKVILIADRKDKEILKIL